MPNPKVAQYESLPAGNNRFEQSLPACRCGEGMIGLCVALVFHLVWLAAAPTSEKPAPATPPTPIQVAWIASPQPRAEMPKPAPQARQKPIIKPKAKPRKPAPVKPKPLLSASNSVSKITAAETVETPKTPIAAGPPPAPAATTATTATSATSTANRGAQSKAASVTQPHLNADYLDNPVPAYPRISRRLGEQGKVLLRVMINTDGTVAQLTVHKTSGFSRLDQTALKTVKDWRFVPARQGGQAVPAWVVVPVSFSLEG